MINQCSLQIKTERKSLRKLSTPMVQEMKESRWSKTSKEILNYLKFKKLSRNLYQCLRS